MKETTYIYPPDGTCIICTEYYECSGCGCWYWVARDEEVGVQETADNEAEAIGKLLMRVAESYCGAVKEENCSALKLYLREGWLDGSV